MWNLQNLWPFSSFKNDDLRSSEHLVSKLSISENTKQFVFAIRNPETSSVIYILSSLNLSQRSVFDAHSLIKEIRPDAVVVQAGHSPWTEILSEERELEDGLDALVPTSSLGVIKRCFVDKIGKEKCENVAGNCVLREIFGTSFHEHVIAAKRAAEQVGSSFVVLELPSLMLSCDNSSLKRFPFSNNVLSQILRPLSLLMDPLMSDQSSLASVEAFEGIQPKSSYEIPDFAKHIYPLFEDLHNIFADFPSIGTSLAHVQKLLLDVNRGEEIDTRVVSKVYTFQIAIEGLRIALSNSGMQPISRKDKIEFSELPAEEKSQMIFAQALRHQTDKFKTIVAVVDAGGLAGIRKYWHTSLPAEVKELVEQAIANSDGDEITSHENNKRSFWEKPTVAVGTGATVVLGTSYLTKVISASTLTKIIMKATASTGKFRAVIQSITASAQRIGITAMRRAYFELMRKRTVQQQPVGFLPWATLACSVGTFAGLLLYGDGIECAVGSLPAASTIATLGRGIQNLRKASQVVMQTEGTRMQNSIESLISRMKKAKAC